MNKEEFITELDKLFPDKYGLQLAIFNLAEKYKSTPHQGETLPLDSVSSRLPFYDELNKMCEHYIETTIKEDKTKWHDRAMAQKVTHWCKWLKIFAKENGY